VAAVGRNVTGLRPGDEVSGEADGAFAVPVRPGRRGGAKPANLTFEQAAAVPLAGNTAVMGLRDAAQVRPGQRVLINGASGGVGGEPDAIRYLEVEHARTKVGTTV
jgi:NADPH:quinone reductase-like Zn-dependent oxidoreductase